MGKNIIIAFLIGLLASNLCYGLKVSDVILSEKTSPDIVEVLQDYIIPILNEGKYQLKIRTDEVMALTNLDSGVLSMDNSGAIKYLVISNGSNNYRVQLTVIP